MKLADRIREQLQLQRARAGAAEGARAPQDGGRAQRLQALRRAISRLERSGTGTGAGTGTGPGTEVARDPVWPDPLPGREPPKAVDEAGLLYRERFAVGRRLGGRALPIPDARALERAMPHLERAARLLGAIGDDEARLRPEQLLFVDTETTGLSRASGTLAFLIGLGFFENADAGPGAFVVEQLFLGDPGREPELLERLRGYLDRARLIVSFNGRAFDLPVLRNRGVLWRVPLALDAPHLDLLAPCRRLFSHRTSDCRLTTLERELHGFVRHDDVDGSEIPGIYVEYLRSGRFGRLEAVLRHNRLDIASMAPLALLVAHQLADPLQWAEDAEALLAAGQLQLLAGDEALAVRCLERGLELARQPRTRHRLLEALARQRRRSGELEQASRLWERYRAEFPEHNTGWIELAKYHEHVTKDLERALALAEAAPHPDLDALAHRLQRLRTRIARRTRTRARGDIGVC